MSEKYRIELGRFVRPVGIKGEIKMLPYEDFWPESLASGLLQLEGSRGTEKVRIECSRPAGNCLALKLAGVDDRDQAEKMRDAALVLEGEMDVPLPEFILPFQVKGFLVKDRDGDVVGEVIELQNGRAQALLRVKGPEREHDIPFVPPILLGVDWEERVIEVDLPQGLLEI